MALGWVLAGQAAYAQRVVVLELSGDRGDRLRSQIEGALKKAGQVELVSIKSYKNTAAKRKLRGAQAMTPAGVSRVGPVLGLDAAIEGALGDTFFVRILDGTGAELWSKDLPIKGGLVSPDHARKLAKAIYAAAKSGMGKSKPALSKVEEEAQEEEAPVVEAPAEDEPKKEEKEETETSNKEELTLPTIDLTENLTEEQRERRRRDEVVEAHTAVTINQEFERDPDLDAESRTTKPRIGPKLLTLSLTGTTTWRAYCSREGLDSCAAFQGDRNLGDADFSSGAPYAGVGVTVELFPMASFDGPLRGVGLVAGYGRGFSLINFDDGGGAPEGRQVLAIDESVVAMAAYRFFFSFGHGGDPVSFVGGRLGMMVRNFEIDPAAQVPLPGSHRLYPALGVDAAVPLFKKMVRAEGSGLVFLNPRAGPDEIAGYGDLNDPSGGASGSGWAVELGLGGEVWGPLGYTFKYRLTHYADRFVGRGQKWLSGSGGVARESYSSLYWGITATF
ncbi:MAG: hypothetical protein ACOZIN_02950 [Myxococcota bacterium]